MVEKVRNYAKYCLVGNLISPTPVVLYQGTRVLGDIGHSDKPYTHVSIDNTILGLEKLFGKSKYSHKKHVLIVTCLFTNHVTI